VTLFDIKHRFSGEVLFKLETESLKLCVEAAVKGRTDLCDADLRDADLRGADLRDADLRGADLCGADLCGADLRDADLRGADLCDADLRDADLCGADLCDADLRDADLCRADLRDADLRDADLCRADLRGVGYVIDLGLPNGWKAHAWLRDGWLSIRVGCQEKRLSEARDYWAGKDYRREVMAAVDYAEAVALLRGWPISAPAEQEAA